MSSRGRTAFFLLVLAISVTFFHLPNACADDAPLDISGEGLIPVGNTTIALISEKVSIQVMVEPTGGAMRQDNPDTATIAAELLFRNRSRQEVQLKLGFPIGNEEMLADLIEERQSGRKDDCSITANGRQVAFTKYLSRNEKDPDMARKWWVWTQSFPPEKTLEIIHTYKGYFGGGHIEPEDYNVRYFRYILTTGSLWKGRIGRAEIEMTFDRPLKPEWFLAFPKPAFQSPKRIRWIFRDFEPTEDIVFAYSWAINKKRLKEYCAELRASTAQRKLETLESFQRISPFPGR